MHGRSVMVILRALGATLGQIRTLFLGESVLAGLFVSALGLLLGIGIARLMLGYIGALLGEVYGMAEKPKKISTNPRLMLLAIVLGFITSVVAALIPALSAARAAPLQPLQPTHTHQLLTT